jgi:hypothetical protein
MKKITLFLSAIVLMSTVFIGCKTPEKETELTVSTTNMSFAATGAEAQTFTVTATAAWTVTTAANWIHVAPTTGVEGKNIAVTVTVDNFDSSAGSPRMDYVTVTCESKTAKVLIMQDPAQGSLPDWVPDISGSYVLIFRDPDTLYTNKASYTIDTNSYEGYPAEITVSATDTGYSAFITVFEGQPAFELVFRREDTTYNIITDDNARGEAQDAEGTYPYYQAAFGIEIDETALNNGGRVVYKRDATTGRLKVYTFKDLWLNIEDGVLTGVYAFEGQTSQGQRIVCVPALGGSIDYQGNRYIFDNFILPQFVPLAYFNSSPVKKASRPFNIVKYKGEIKEAQFAPKEMFKSSAIQKISKRK